jgi:hypothetical protein
MCPVGVVPLRPRPFPGAGMRERDGERNVVVAAPVSAVHVPVAAGDRPHGGLDFFLSFALASRAPDACLCRDTVFFFFSAGFVSCCSMRSLSPSVPPNSSGWARRFHPSRELNTLPRRFRISAGNSLGRQLC